MRLHILYVIIKSALRANTVWGKIMEKSESIQSSKISKQNWIIIWIAGLAGQLCWNIENQWFNTFVYAKISPNPSIITWMVAVSAIVTTLSTFISGTGSDRLGRRKPFIVIGYIMWGLTTILFGITEFIKFKELWAIITMIVFADAMMSFFGSLGNDAGFNPWTTDITDESNRGSLGAVIAIQPIVATIVGSLLGGFIIQALDYIWFFTIMGTFVIGVGIYCKFKLKDSPALKPNRDEKGFWHQFGWAFNFRLLKNNKMLFIVLSIFAAFFISFNVYFPHMLNYFMYTRGYDEGMSGVLLGVGLIIAVPLTLVASKFINKGKFVLISVLAVIANIIGLLIMGMSTAADSNAALKAAVIVLAVIFVGGGYMVIYQTLMIWCKNLYPEEQRGQLEGVRLFFYVCVPMVIGPSIANPVIKTLGKAITIEYPTGIQNGFAPSTELFYIAAAVALLTFIPIFFAHLYMKKHPSKAVNAEISDKAE